MKVVMLSVYPSEHKPAGGVYSVTATLAQSLVKYTHANVHVVTLEHKRTKIAVEQDGDVIVHRLPGSCLPSIVDIHCGPGKRRLARYITALEPDILHIHETYGLGLGNSPIPHVFTIHGFDHANLVADSARFAWLRSRLWKLAERRGFAKHRHIISITPYVKEMIEHLTHARIYDIENPVDERFFKIARKPEAGRILCVGWVNERKNTLGAVKAFAGVVDCGMEAKLVIAGEAQEAKYFDRIKKSIEYYEIADRVELLGYINHAQLEHELARASVFLLPSRQENSPMAIAEAMAAGVPVIASNRCGMPYMVSEGTTGFLIDPESTDQIAGRLADLVGSQELCQQMGHAGRQAATERFHPNTVALRTREVYERICASAQRATCNQGN